MTDYFSSFPLSVIYAFTFVLVLASLVIGALLGHRYVARVGEQKDSSIGSAVAAMLGLLAFMLAFTFNMTADRFNERKGLLLDEVNAIGTVYLRADFLKPEARDRAKALLREYTAVQDFVPGRNTDDNGILARSAEIFKELWGLVDQHIEQGYEASRLRLFVEPLNDVMDFHTARDVVGLEYHIPEPIWVALYFITALAMLGIGFQFGANRAGSLHVGVTLALIFSTVILLISDLDRAREGFLVVDQRPMAELHQQLEQSQRERPAER